ncbi:MAG: lipopolysaccharide heptosyltransferase I [Chlamydiales bacterium 38-26]|nr:lipopolysaccharide heptosyltransferase I [Chlamydiales bacterium]OJV08595.1 MAG: lipopolysaccharide heptosyltransferase I [Chlamydiales bacterium 38-26]
MRILIVKTSSLGDIIHAFPLVDFLHQEFPGVLIDWVVEKNFSEIVHAHPFIHRVIEIDTKGWRKGIGQPTTWKAMKNFRREMQAETYEVVFDLQGNTKSAIPTYLSRSQHKVGFGLKTIHEWPNVLFTNHRYNPPLNLNVREENLYLAQQYFQRNTQVENEKVTLKLNQEQLAVCHHIKEQLRKASGKKILVCAGSAWKNKKLSSDALEFFLRKVSGVFSVSFFLAWGSKEEFLEAQKLQEVLGENACVLDKLSLPVLQNVMTEMDVVIAMDSLPLHLAGTSGTPTFSVFGASSASKYNPKGEKNIALQGECPYGRVFERRCPILRTCQTGLCIRSLPGEKIFQAFDNFFRKLP